MAVSKEGATVPIQPPASWLIPAWEAAPDWKLKPAQIPSAAAALELQTRRQFALDAELSLLAFDFLSRRIYRQALRSRPVLAISCSLDLVQTVLLC